MTNLDSVTIEVPATTANIGPGFDCLGAALTLYNRFKFTRSQDETRIMVRGNSAEQISLEKNNLLYQSFTRFYEYINQPPPSVQIEIDLVIPLARGLGSSATAIVGGLVAANTLEGNLLNRSQIRDLAIAIEGHPDNVVPALEGNCVLCVNTNEGWQVIKLNWDENIVPVVAIPDFELSTESARKVLPPHVSYESAIFNIAHLGLLLRGLETNNAHWLKSALDDRLHQPYRKSLIPGYDLVREKVISAGAYGLVISGAGPTLLALTDKSKADIVCQVMEETWSTQGIKVDVRCLSLDCQGTRIISN
jgi:homoserine kinase